MSRDLSHSGKRNLSFFNTIGVTTLSPSVDVDEDSRKQILGLGDVTSFFIGWLVGPISILIGCMTSTGL